MGKGQKGNVAKCAIFWLWVYDVQTHCMRICIQTSTFKRYLNIANTGEDMFSIMLIIGWRGGGVPTFKVI